MFNAENTTIICIDLQEKLIKKKKNGAIIKENSVKLMKAANILNINTIITEQYPKGLGDTTEDIKSIKNFLTIEKNTFSAYQTKEFQENFKKIENKNIIIFGIETHICVLQTVIDLIDEGYNVFILKDCSASRNEENHNVALELAKQKGASIITLEIALFNFLKSSKHQHFKEIQMLIK